MRSIVFFLLASASLWCGERGWNCAEIVEAYYSHSELQRSWAHELIDSLSFKGSENVLDFGCGDGKITAEIARLVPRGTVVGCDISPWMIASAQTHFPAQTYSNLHFQTAEIQGSYDIICSFCVLQFVSDPVAVLNDLKSHLKPDGLLLLTIPGAPDSIMRQAANEILDKYSIERPWSLPNYAGTSIRTVKGCESRLHEVGLEILSLKHLKSFCFLDILPSLKEWDSYGGQLRIS